MSALFPILEIAIISPYLTFNDQGPTLILPSILPSIIESFKTYCSLKAFGELQILEETLNYLLFPFILVMVEVPTQAHLYFKLFSSILLPSAWQVNHRSCSNGLVVDWMRGWNLTQGELIPRLTATQEDVWFKRLCSMVVTVFSWACQTHFFWNLPRRI